MKENTNLKIIDEEIDKIYKKIDFYQYLTPINFEEENNKFINCFNKGIQYNPIYLYKDINKDYDIPSILEQLSFYKNLIIQKEGIFSKKLLEAIIEMENKLEVCKNIGKSDVISIYSKHTYGIPSEKLVGKAYQILEKESSIEENLIYQAEQCKVVFEEFMKKVGIYWKIVLDKNQTAKVNVQPEKKVISIKKNEQFSTNDLKRLLVHEIGTHVLRAENGSRQKYKIFSLCLEKNLATEEGLATWNEETLGVLNQRVFRIYAGRVIAVAQSFNKSFYEVYKELRKYFNEKDAMYITARVKRGIQYTEQGGAFGKDFVYFEGYYKIKSFCEKNEEEDLYVGIINMDEVEECNKLLKEGKLEKPAIDFKKVINVLQQKMS